MVIESTPDHPCWDRDFFKSWQEVKLANKRAICLLINSLKKRTDAEIYNQCLRPTEEPYPIQTKQIEASPLRLPYEPPDL